jgi:hypothetical protein
LTFDVYRRGDDDTKLAPYSLVIEARTALSASSDSTTASVLM